jgi:Omp85 superfamily domain
LARFFKLSVFLALAVACQANAQDPVPVKLQDPAVSKHQDSLARQSRDTIPVKHPDSATSHHLHVFSGRDQVDLIDVGRSIFLKHPGVRVDSSGKKAGKFYPAVLPSAEYTLETGLAFDLTGSLAFYTGEGVEDNISNIYLASVFTQKNQILMPLQANIWTKGNKFNIITDWRFEIFPQDTYGLGTLTTTADANPIDYNYLRFYSTLLKTIAHDFYLGFGYDVDYFWNVREVNPPGAIPTDFEKYGITSTSVSSGPTLNILYDGRRNEINPEPGYYASIIYRPNFTFLGSDVNWQSLQIDGRRYQHFPASSKNTLAFWTYDVFTLSGNPPYLNLPSTESDTYANMGRGYIGGRFRGRNMLYLESEYRYGILRNGFLGGVVFVNAQSFSEPVTNRFEAIAPGWGAGIRIKLNKFPHTNIALDYGFGLHGSQGIFANLGEVF